eukprot:SAG11_NODE_74_length_18043_cov_13.387818_19_plen_36_part_00
MQLRSVIYTAATYDSRQVLRVIINITPPIMEVRMR